MAFLSRMQLLENYDYNDEYDDKEADDIYKELYL